MNKQEEFHATTTP